MIARHSHDAQETTHNQLSSSSSSSGGANRADRNVKHRQEGYDGVHEQDADMNREYDADSKRKTLSSKATHRSKPQRAGVPKFWDHVNSGELSAIKVRKVCRLEVECLNLMKVVERVPSSFVKHRTCKEPIKFKWVDTLKTSGIHRFWLVANMVAALNGTRAERKMWSKRCPEHGPLRVSLYGARDPAANWEDEYAAVLREHQFDRELVSMFILFTLRAGLSFTEMTSCEADPSTS